MIMVLENSLIKRRRYSVLATFKCKDCHHTWQARGKGEFFGRQCVWCQSTNSDTLDNEEGEGYISKVVDDDPEKLMEEINKQVTEDLNKEALNLQEDKGSN